LPISGPARREAGQRCGILERTALSDNQELLLINFDDLGLIRKPSDLPMFAGRGRATPGSTLHANRSQ
jgi:hypothetical protein